MKDVEGLEKAITKLFPRLNHHEVVRMPVFVLASTSKAPSGIPRIAKGAQLGFEGLTAEN